HLALAARAERLISGSALNSYPIFAHFIPLVGSRLVIRSRRTLPMRRFALRGPCIPSAGKLRPRVSRHSTAGLAHRDPSPTRSRSVKSDRERRGSHGPREL